MSPAFLIGVVCGAAVMHPDARVLFAAFFFALCVSARWPVRTTFVPFVCGFGAGAIRSFFPPLFHFSSVSLVPAVRDALAARLATTLPSVPAALADGLLLGGSSGFPLGLRDAFQITGLLHIVAVSGYNVSLISLFFLGAFSSLPRKLRMVMTAAALLFFLALVGLSEATTRAALMGVLALLGRFVGRPRDTMFLLLLVAVLFVALDGAVIGSVSFQLSFLATFGLVMFSEGIARFFRRLPKGCAELFSSTLAAQIVTLPVLLVWFGFFSAAAPLVNFVVLPLVPIAMLLSALVLVCSFAFPMLVAPAALVATGVLQFIVWIVVAVTPLASVGLAWRFFPLPLLFAYYFCLFRIGKRWAAPLLDRAG